MSQCLNFNEHKIQKTLSAQQISPPSGWRILRNPRLLPILRNKASFITRIKLYHVKKYPKSHIDNLILLMKRNTRLYHGMNAFVSKLMPYGELERKDIEVIIIREAWNCRARYVWGQHVTSIELFDLRCLHSEISIATNCNE